MKSLFSFLLFLSTTALFAQYVVSTEAGSGFTGHLDGAASTAAFNRPVGIVVDDAQNIYIADFLNHCIRKIDTNGNVSTIAGSPGNSGFANGNGSAARFDRPGGIDVDQFGNIYVTDNFNHRIRKIDPLGNVNTIAGNGNIGFVNGLGAFAQLNQPRDLAVDRNDGSVYFVDRNDVIRRVDSNGIVSTFAGDGTAGFVDGPLAQARFDFPSGLTIDSIGNIYIADRYNHAIRVIKGNGLVTTIAGTGFSGFNDGVALNAQFNQPMNLDVDENGTLYVADLINYRVRMITNGVVSTIAGNGIQGYVDGNTIVSRIGQTFDVAVLNSTNIYFNDASSERVRKISSISTNLKEITKDQSEVFFAYEGANLINYQSSEAFSYQLLSVNGSLILEGRLNAGNGQIELPELSSGIYLVRSISDQGRSSTLKISKP